MNARTFPSNRQAGYMLLEVLVSLLIFSVGVLGLAALQAASIKNNGAAKYRIDASNLVGELIGIMWSDDRTPAPVQGGESALQTKFQGGQGADGAGYTDWRNRVQALLPGVDTNPPLVAVTPVNVSNPYDAAKGKSRVSVTVRWQVPGETEVHSYVAVAEIK